MSEQKPESRRDAVPESAKGGGAADGATTTGDAGASGARGKKQPSNLVVRTISGAVYALSIVACLYAGPVPTAVLVSIMATLACVEVYRMMRLSGRMPNEKIGLVASIAFPLVALMRSPLYVLVAVMCLVVAVAVWFVAKPRASVADVAVTFFAPIYTSLMYSSIVFVRCVDAGFSGAFLAFGVMGSVWLNDACAYFVGSRFGTRKLAPQISPNKSVEGFVGGLVGGMIAWVILAATGCCGMNFAIALPTGLASGIAAVMGDLFESRIKRGVGVKDSGNLIPGHGGMLDRCDSMLFAAAVASLGLLAGGIL